MLWEVCGGVQLQFASSRVHSEARRRCYSSSSQSQEFSSGESRQDDSLLWECYGTSIGCGLQHNSVEDQGGRGH